MYIDKMRVRAVNKLTELGWQFVDGNWVEPPKQQQADHYSVVASGLQMSQSSAYADLINYKNAFMEAHYKAVQNDAAFLKPQNAIYRAEDILMWIDQIKQKHNIK